MSGSVSYHSGRAAEDIVARTYQDRGYSVCVRRWRSAAGEIDLVMRNESETVFVEVKKARSFSAAAERLGAAQIRRIGRAAELWLGERDPAGTDGESRFDVALVNATGQVSILENVGAF